MLHNKFFITVLLILNISTFCKIMGPEAYESSLQTMSLDELKQAYNQQRKKLTAPSREWPEGIEQDITWQDKPEYKMQMFNSVVKEVARRADQATTIEELIKITDKFFSHNTTVVSANKNNKTKNR